MVNMSAANRILLGAWISLAAAPSERASAMMMESVQVIESNVSDISVGARFPKDWTPQLPPGGQVTVILLPSNQTKTFRGRPPSGGAIGGSASVTDPNESTTVRVGGATPRERVLTTAPPRQPDAACWSLTGLWTGKC